MNQPSLLDPKVAKPEFTIPEETLAPVANTEIAIAAPPQPGRTMLDFREGVMEMSIPVMQHYLAEYADWRKAFRQWLLSIMVEGVHYGWAIGFSPKWCDEKGKPLAEEVATHTKVWKKNKGGEGGNDVLTPITEWLPKRNLLLAGADLVCDVLWVRDEYEADMQTWEQLGKKPGLIVKRCKLYSKINNKFIGEGSGGRENGEKFMGMNSSIKMAENSAKRCAVLNAYGLRDLFTQDMEDPPGPPKRESPAADPTAPTSAPRGERITAEQVAELSARWKKLPRESAPDADLFTLWQKFVQDSCRRTFDIKKSVNWTLTDWQSVDGSLAVKESAAVTRTGDEVPF